MSILTDGTPIPERWEQTYERVSDPRFTVCLDVNIKKLIEELSAAEQRERVLSKALEDVVYGNDIAHDRKHTLESWPDSTFRKRAIALLFPTEQPNVEEEGER